LKSSLIVFRNFRFPSIRVFADSERVGDIAYSGSFQYPTETGKNNSFSFEIRDLDRSLQASQSTKSLLERGISINCKPGEGTEVIFDGPPVSWMPAPKSVLPTPPPVFKVDATGTIATVPEFKYKDITIKGEALKLGFTKEGDSGQFTWIVQDCTVEKDGAVAYTPPEKPFSTKTVSIVSKNGKPEVKE